MKVPRLNVFQAVQFAGKLMAEVNDARDLFVDAQAISSEQGSRITRHEAEEITREILNGVLPSLVDFLFDGLLEEDDTSHR